MNTNVCSWDRGVRIVLGGALIGATLMDAIGAWGWIGVVPLVTGLVGFCLLYRIVGFNSCTLK